MIVYQDTCKTECDSILTYFNSNIILHSFRFLLFTHHFSSPVTKILFIVIVLIDDLIILYSKRHFVKYRI